MNERVFPTKGRFRGTYAGDVTDCVGSRGERSHGTLTRESRGGRAVWAFRSYFFGTWY